MTDLISSMVGKFEMIERQVDAEQRSARKARNRFRAIEMYDSSLAALMQRAARIDLGIAGIAGAMSQQKFDEKTQRIVFLNPNLADMPSVINSIDHDDAIFQVRFAKSKYDLENRDLAKFFSIATVANESDIESFCVLLNNGIATIDDLTTSIAAFFKANFKLEELL